MIEIGKTYVHTKTDKRYRVIGTLLFKVGNEWIESVRYVGLGGEFGRSIDDFLEHFRPV